MARAYRQGLRTVAAAETGEKIVSAARTLFTGCWIEDVRLQQVADAAGGAVQTVIRSEMEATLESRVEALLDPNKGDDSCRCSPSD